MFEKGNNCGVIGGLSQEKLRPKMGLMNWRLRKSWVLLRNEVEAIYRELRTVFSPPWTSHLSSCVWRKADWIDSQPCSPNLPLIWGKIREQVW